uniref:RNase H type-1 domain-containing protein n=1 Tax=Fagus sylvatica TaxID=28930 RepID=A0A2N9E139_FAGSY
MNGLLQVSSYTAAIFRRTSHFVPKSCLYGCATISWKTKSFEHIGLELVLTRFRVHCYSSRRGTTKSASSRTRKLDSEPVMEQEKDAFFVQEKEDAFYCCGGIGDILLIGICDPPVSVYKGYSLPKGYRGIYLVSRGLKNAVYTIRAADLKEDLLFGTLMHCPFSTSFRGETSSKDASKKRSQEALGSEIVDLTGSASISTDPSGKHVKLDHSALAEALPTACRSCTVAFDGASKGNPGQAGAGAVLRADDGSLICRLREGLGTATNNVAEYRAMILGLRYAIKRGFTSIRLQGDSKLVCMQVQGLWKVKNQNMSDLYEVAKNLKNKFVSFEINHVLRELNSEADAQANLAISLADGQVQEELDK